MRGIIGLLILMFVVALPALPAAAQQEAEACSPDLSGVATLLEEAQTAIDTGDNEAVLGAISGLRMEMQLVEAQCMNSADRGAGNSRTNPVAAGERQYVEYRDFVGDLEVIEFIEDANEMVSDANMFNQSPEDGKQYIAVTVTQHCDRSPDESCHFSLGDFSVVGRKGVVYTWSDSIVSGLADSKEFFGGGQITSVLAYLVDSDDSDFVLFNSRGDNRVYFAAQ